MKRLTNVLLERYGKFPFVDEISDKLMKFVEEFRLLIQKENILNKEYELDCSKYDRLPFKTIICNVFNYGDKPSTFVPDKKYYEKDIIYININVKTSDVNTIIHELTHAYQNINMYKHGVRTLIDRYTQEYKSFNAINNSSNIYQSENSFINDKDFNYLKSKRKQNQVRVLSDGTVIDSSKYYAVVKLCAKEIIYYLDQYEIHAYISEIENDIIKYIKTNNISKDDFSYTSMIKYMCENNPKWSAYERLYKLNKSVNNKTIDDETWNSICKEYNNIGHVNKSNKEINKLLTSKLKRLTKLINKHIPYIVCEYYSKIK